MTEETIKKLLIDQKSVETTYGIPVSTQENLRRDGTFAKWMRVGNKIYYRVTELEAFLDDAQANARFAKEGD